VSKDGLDKAADAIKRTTDNVRDAIQEGRHRTAADAEKARRQAFDSELTGAEKAKSLLHQTKERTQAEIDAAKREVRKHT
jgi:ABC-type transporter Mla subunit MlaD